MRLFHCLALLPLALARETVRTLHLETGAVPQTYVNTAVARTVELGGSTTLVTSQYNVKALVDEPGGYVLALAGEGAQEPAWYEVLVGGKAVSTGPTQYLAGAPVVVVPLDLKKDDAVAISVSAIVAHANRPLPASVEQRDPQCMVWETPSTLVDSAYTCDVERIKIRSPTPNILSYANVPKTYTRDSDVTKAASTVVLGPFHNVPPTLGADAKATQTPFYVHFETREPIVGIRKLRRSAEVSHWGANLNIQDEVELFNDGPALKGHFSRLLHQQSRYHAHKPAQVLNEVTMRIPPSAHSVYYYDVIGNVSTSHFREGSPASASAVVSGKPKRARVVDGVLELKPRYPVLGGWNYTFVVGWDSPLCEALKIDSGKQVLAVPFLTPLKDVIVDEEEFSVILPEGATDVEVFAPFPVDEIEHTVHKTYLDTTGRPKVSISKKFVTENHALPVYVTYRYPTSAQWGKPLTVSMFVGAGLAAFLLMRRVSYDIEK